MTDLETVRRLAFALPETGAESKPDWLGLKVAGKQFAWTWLERTAPKQPRVPRPEVLAVRCELARKELLIAAAPQTYFDEPHYAGFPAVLVRLATISEPDLAALLQRAWRLQAPKRLAPGSVNAAGATDD